MKLNNILIIDGSNFLHRQLNQPELANLEYNGRKTGAIYGFLRSLQTSISRYPTYYPIVTFDYGKSPRRLQIYPNYKHTLDRKLEKEETKKQVDNGFLTIDALNNEYLDELIRQGDLVREFLRVVNIPCLMISKWEGDDLMAILSRCCEDCVVATDDKDMYQLVNDHCKIFRPMRDDEYGNRGKEITSDDVVDPRYGNTRAYVVYKSIVGDGSDNIPKVARGLGPKKAQQITDIIMENDEDPSRYLSIFSESTKSHFKAFADNFMQYKINVNLIDLSLVDNDPIVLSTLSNEVLMTSREMDYMKVVQFLGSQGIQKFDYPKLMSCLVRSRSQIEV